MALDLLAVGERIAKADLERARAKKCFAKLCANGKYCQERAEEDSRRCRIHRDTACYCCGWEDDPNGPGPAINTGFCVECKTAGCPDRDVGGPCVAELAP